ncbi:MAG TPA: AMP-binding protein [Candidatus Limnocylindrales bacterium]|nr:AMP-binding protein [Candidatus Limnocylindrales bacterium]
MLAKTLIDLVCRGCAPSRGVSGADGVELDHVALCNAADALGAALAARGVEPGDHVASALAPGTAAFAAALLGVASIRAALAPLPPVADEPSARAALRDRPVAALLATANLPAGVRSAAAAQGIRVIMVDFDDRGIVLVDGEHVYEAHARIAEPEDVVFVPAGGGAPLTQEALAGLAGERGLDGLLEAVRAAGEPALCAA